jgi:DNA polymerase-3 subunit epsilon
MREPARQWDQTDLLPDLLPDLVPESLPQRLPEPLPNLMPAQEEDPAPPRALELPVFQAEAAPRPTVPSRLLILDTETTGLSPTDGTCIEVGAVLFAVPQREVLMQVSFLLPCHTNPAESINGIEAATTRLPQPWRAGLACFRAMVDDCEAVVAHNAAFDRQWFGHGELPALERPWICSMEDIRWPAERQLRATPSVRDLALAYGVPVWAAHRALTDCIYLAQVFERCADLEALLAAALEPRRLYRACLSYDERHRARAAGFRWNDPVPKAWTRRLSEREVQALPFAVEAVAA